MKLQPQDWMQLAAIKAVRVPRLGEPAIGTIRKRAIDRAGAPTPTTAPLAPRRSLLSMLAVPVLAIIAAPWAGWLATQHGSAALRGALAGSGITAALLLPLVLCLWRRARALATEAATARRQQVNILGGLREGLFLVGRDLRLSATCSASTGEVLRLSAPGGRRLEDVLRPLLNDEETLAAALTFLQLLWNDEADDDAIESLNPLQQVPVFFSDARGARERRYLSFSFRRVVSALPADDCILGAVADVTDRVLLAQELEQAEAAGDSQAELLLQLVRTDPIALVKFLDDADTAFRKSNAILTAPGSGPQQLHKRLMGVLRELDAITSAAEVLPFASFAQRLQSIDDVLAGLCAKTPLSGNDFLPVVVGLDELMSHAATMRTIHQHIVLLRAASAALAGLDQRDSSHITGPLVLDLS